MQMKTFAFDSAFVKRNQILPSVGHAPSGLGQYGFHPPDADENLTAKSKALS